MQRRRLLGRVVGLVGVGSLAGCTEGSGPTGPRAPPESPTPTATPTSGIVIETWDIKNGTDGSLIVPITLENTGDREGSRGVILDVSVGNETYNRKQTVTLDSGETKTVEIEFEVTFQSFLKDGSLNLELEGEE
jgi:hypothetical protein